MGYSTWRSNHRSDESGGTLTTDKLGGVKGLASGPDSSLYATFPSAVLKIKLDGTLTTLIHPIVLEDCDTDLPPETPESQKPYLRELAVDRRETVYTAAIGCRCVLKITPEGQVKTILTAERPLVADWYCSVR